MSGRCTVVVGCQWGDEGKGKIVDVLAEEVDIVARYQGGANAGHTVHVADDTVVLHQLPSGILHPGKRCLLGNGVVLDIARFFEECDAVQARGVDISGRVGVSERAHLVLPYHRVLDRVLEESASATDRIGTTGRGIGPAYEFKAGRRGIRVADAADDRRFRELLDSGLERARASMPRLEPDEARALDEAVETTARLARRLREFATDTGMEVAEALASGRSVLLEGAQGTALDLDHGTYPFVTSSNTTAGGAATGIGIGPTRITSVLGVVKSYTTRVGNGPLPTAFAPEMDEHMRKLGSEFGATTGRPRRCGWFDAVLARYSARVNGLTGLAVTKLDVLDSLAEISIATAYDIEDGSCIREFPADTSTLESVEPRYETLPGWEADTSGARSLSDLPRNARAYLDRIQELTDTPIDWISVGTHRDQIVRVD